MINKIKIRKFKSFENEEVEFVNGLNVIVGSNGAGKTNLIEAIKEGLTKLSKNIDVDRDRGEMPVILDNPKKLPKRRQLIIVTDNDSFIKKADKIIGVSFENGKSHISVLGENNEKQKVN